jgi:hypothetical protein
VVKAVVWATRADAAINDIENDEFITGFAKGVMPRLYEDGYTLR